MIFAKYGIPTPRGGLADSAAQARSQLVANGILEVGKRVGFAKPFVIRLVGTNEEEGRRILTEIGIHVLNSIEEAAKKAVEMAKAAGD